MRNENSLEVYYMTGSKSFITQPSNDGTVVAKERILVHVHNQYTSFVSHCSYLCNLIAKFSNSSKEKSSLDKIEETIKEA